MKQSYKLQQAELAIKELTCQVGHLRHEVSHKNAIIADILDDNKKELESLRAELISAEQHIKDLVGDL